MSTFLAHYTSLDADAKRAKGLFDFESDARLGSKANKHDARIKMLELFGNDALSWQIDRIERKTNPRRSGSQQMDGQLELDFRDPIKKRKRQQKRGIC